MKKLLTGLVVAGLAMGVASGCKKEPANKPAPASGKGAPAATGATGTPASATPAAAAPTRDTARGTVELFIKAMQDGDFIAAADLCDPSTEGHKELMGTANAVQLAKENDKLPSDEIVKLITMQFSQGYVGASVADASEDGTRAGVSVRLRGGETMDLTLNKFENKWMILAPQTILLTGSSAPKATPAPADPAMPAPVTEPDTGGSEPPAEPAPSGSGDTPSKGS